MRQNAPSRNVIGMMISSANTERNLARSVLIKGERGLTLSQIDDMSILRPVARPRRDIDQFLGVMPWERCPTPSMPPTIICTNLKRRSPAIRPEDRSVGKEGVSKC